VQKAKQNVVQAVMARIKRAPKPTSRQALLMAALGIIFILTATRIVGLISELREVKAARNVLEAKRNELETRHRDLEEQAQFIADPDNLEQELRSRFNYKNPNEKVIVVIPPKETKNP
jgi:cell division protein FtsB